MSDDLPARLEALAAKRIGGSNAILREAAARVRELEDALREIVSIYDGSLTTGTAALVMMQRANTALREGGNG
jgi:hypothetical protein